MYVKIFTKPKYKSWIKYNDYKYHLLHTKSIQIIPIVHIYTWFWLIWFQEYLIILFDIGPTYNTYGIIISKLILSKLISQIWAFWLDANKNAQIWEISFDEINLEMILLLLILRKIVFRAAFSKFDGKVSNHILITLLS